MPSGVMLGAVQREYAPEMFRETEIILTDPATMPLVLIALLVLAVFWTLVALGPDTKPRTPKFSDSKVLNAMAWGAVILSPLGAFIFAAALWELAMLAWHYPTAKTIASELGFHSSLMLAMLAALGALFTLLFAYIKVFTTERQTKATEEALFNDKINAASASLYATRQISRRFQAMDERPEWRDLHEDDIVRRNAAIDALEGLADERPDQAVRIARMLSVYGRELSREVPPVPMPDGLTSRKIRDWAWRLEPLRSDMHSAVRALGRLRAKHASRFAAERIDLRRANLQGMDLTGDDLSFEGVLFGETQMQGADLWRAQMQGAYLGGAQMDAATNLSAAPLLGAALRLVNYTNVAISQAQVDSVFYDGSVTFAPKITRAEGRDEELAGNEFETRWRAWQKSIGFDPDAPGG